MGSEKEQTYQRLVEEIVGKAEFEDRFKWMKDAAEDFLEQAGYAQNVACNDRILLHVLLDYYSDIQRLKDFHGIERVRTDKIFAYTIKWILRRKPLQFKNESIEETDIFVNERFALFLMVDECVLKKVNKVLEPEASKKFDEYIDYVLYYFKYRECNAQVIELMIESFKMGLEFKKNDYNEEK